MLDLLPLLAIREPGLSDHLAHGDLSGLPVFPPPAVQRVPVGVAQLGYRVGVAVVESDEGLDCDPSLFGAEHAASFLSRFGPRFPPQSPTRMRQQTGRPGCGQPSSTQHAAGQAARTGGEYIELSGTVAPCRNDVRSRLSFFSHEDVLSLMLCLALDEYRYIPRY